jgi:hypothetical protein
MTEMDIAYQRLHNQKVSQSTSTKPEDVVRWMLHLLSQQVIVRNGRVRRKAGLDEATFRKSKNILAKLLQGKEVTRNEVYDALERAGIAAHLKTPVGSRGMHIIGHLALEGFICFGPRRGKQPTFVLLDEWVPNPRHLTRNEALAELAGRYFRSRGPATDYDFAWWSGLPVLEARASIDMVRPPLAKEKLAGNTYWFAGSVPAAVRSSEQAYLLPYVDEYTVAYKDRSALADPELMKRIRAGSPVGILGPLIVMNGRIVGIWKRTIEKRKVVISTNLFTPNAQKAVAAAAQRYGSFVAAGCFGAITSACSRPFPMTIATAACGIFESAPLMVLRFAEIPRETS